jgi:hypothetical protein
MNQGQRTKILGGASPTAYVDNGAFTFAAWDTRGAGYAVITVYLGDTDIAMGSLKLQESEDNGSADAYADVDGAIFGTSKNIDGVVSALPGATDDDKFWRIEVNLKKRERFLQLVGTAGNGTNGTRLAAWCELFDLDEMPDTMAEKGCAQVLRV